MKKFLFRISLLVIILAVFIYYIMRNLGTLEHTVSVTLSQSLGYIAIAFAFASIAFFFLISMHQRVLSMLGIRRTKFQMFLLQTESLAMNVIVPSAGVSVGVVFASDAKKNGDSEAAAITGVILALLVDYASIAILLSTAMLYLYSLKSLGLQVTIPAVAFFILTIGLFLLIYYAGKNKVVLKRFLDWCKGIANKVAKTFGKKAAFKNETIVDNFITELENAYNIMRSDRRELYISLGYMLLCHLMYLVALYVLFLSLGIEPLYRVLLSGYAIGIMLVVVSPTPNGVGFVEGSMALAYASMGVAGAAAATVTLIYRGFSFWLPLFIGFFALQRKHLLNLVEKARN